MVIYNTAADTVFVNGKVITVDKSFSIKEAIAVKNGWVIDVGQNNEIEQYIDHKTEVIDLEGKTILPTAHDSHAHAAVWGANALFTFDCSPLRVRTVGDLRDVLSEKAKNAKPGEWLRGCGMNYNAFSDLDASQVSRELIDDIAPNNPIIVSDWSGHSILINKKALDLCQINKDTLDPKHGRIIRDENGEPTGVFMEGAISFITEKVPLWTDSELKAAIIGVQKHLNSMGYGSYTECTLGPAGNFRDSGASGERAIAIYKTLQDEGLLSARVSIGLYTGYKAVQSYDYLKADLANMVLPELEDEDWLNISMVKIFADGVYLDYTSWLLDDYSDKAGYHGKSCFNGTDEEQSEELQKMIQFAHQNGYRVGLHTIGDRAIQTSLDGIIKAMTEYPRKNPRHYLIHAESMATDMMIDKMVKYGIPISVQPGLGANLYEVSLERLGKERGNKVFGLKRWLDRGAILSGGTDSIGGPYLGWLQAVQSAVTRKSAISGKVFAPELTVSVEDAIRMFTINGAYQEHFEDVRGSIEIGKVADFQVLDQDILNVDPDDIGKIQVELTMVGGKIVYKK